MPTDTLTLSEQAGSTIREMIVRGEYVSGQWLRKRDVAKRLQMSATPVVEAFRRLELEGLVETAPQWGTRVRVFTVAEIFELAGMRLGLEAFVARCCATRLSKTDIDSLRPLAEAVDSADAKLSKPSSHHVHGHLLEMDAHFHRELALKAKLTMVVREIDRLRVLEATCRLWQIPGIQTRVTHQLLLDAINSHDPAVTETAMRHHIQDSVDSYLPVLRERFGDGPITIEQKSG